MNNASSTQQTWTFKDEINSWFKSPEASTVPVTEAAPVNHVDHDTDTAVEIRVTFNRDLTWSEREAFRQWTLEKGYLFIFHRPSVVFVADALSDTEEETRELYEAVAEFVATQFVNVHPRAVKTISPEVIV